MRRRTLTAIGLAAATALTLACTGVTTTRTPPEPNLEFVEYVNDALPGNQGIGVRIIKAEGDDSCSSLLDYCVEVRCEIENRSTVEAAPLLDVSFKEHSRRERVELRRGERKVFSFRFDEAKLFGKGKPKLNCRLADTTSGIPFRLGCRIRNPATVPQAGEVTFGSVRERVQLKPGEETTVIGPWFVDVESVKTLPDSAGCSVQTDSR